MKALKFELAALVGIGSLILGGCGVPINTSSQSPPSSSPASQSPSAPRSSSPVAPPPSHSQLVASGPTVTLSGTLTQDGTALFPAWVGGTNSSGQFQWVPVTVQLDSGAQESQVSGTVLEQNGLTHTTQSTGFTGIGGTVTGYWFPHLSLIPQADPRDPIFTNRGLYSGLGGLGTEVAAVNIGQDILQTASFQINGSHWTFTYQPTAAPPNPTLPSTSPSPTSTPPSAQSNSTGPGYLGVEVTSTPQDWTVQGCQVYTVLAGSPASTTALVGQTQRTDPVGDVITQISDTTKNWGPLTVSNCSQLQQDMSNTSPGDQVTLGYYHRVVFILGHWEAESASVTLGVWPQGLQTQGQPTL